MRTLECESPSSGDYSVLHCGGAPLARIRGVAQSHPAQRGSSGAGGWHVAPFQRAATAASRRHSSPASASSLPRVEHVTRCDCALTLLRVLRLAVWVREERRLRGSNREAATEQRRPRDQSTAAASQATLANSSSRAVEQERSRSRNQQRRVDVVRRQPWCQKHAQRLEQARVDWRRRPRRATTRQGTSFG